MVWRSSWLGNVLADVMTRFTKTKAMQDLLAERQRVRNAKSSEKPAESNTKASKTSATSLTGDKKASLNGSSDSGPDLAQLVKSVKRKAELHASTAGNTGKGDGGEGGSGKKRKRTRAKGKGAKAE